MRRLRLVAQPPRRAQRQLGSWQVSGYQFDMNSANNYTGQLYEGQGRGIVNAPGGMVSLLPGNCSARIATVEREPGGGGEAPRWR